jgi:hypothetical protein
MPSPDHKHDRDLQADPGPMLRLSEGEIQVLADRLFSRGISSITAYSRREQADLIAASRVLRALLRLHELETGRQLRFVLLCGGY